MKIIGYTRIRNESLILQETLDHWGEICDAIYVLDDCSTDNTVAIAEAHPKVKAVLRTLDWQPGIQQNGIQRQRIYSEACRKEKPTREDWVCCFDADERLEGLTRAQIEKVSPGIDGIICRLFDFYITPEDVGRKYEGNLKQLREWAGPEYRDQLFFFRWSPSIGYWDNKTEREPHDSRGAIHCARMGFVRHYGKCLSVEHWEETCDYYAEHFPPPTSTKWMARKGKAVHTESDFGAPLYRVENLAALGEKPGAKSLYRYPHGHFE